VEAIGCLLGGEHGNVVRELRVERLRRALDRRAARDVEARDLAPGVHARVRATGDGQAVGSAVGAGKRVAQDALDGSLPGLSRPARKAGPVVFERQPELQEAALAAAAGATAARRAFGSWSTSSRYAIGAESPCRGPIRTMRV